LSYGTPLAEKLVTLWELQKEKKRGNSSKIYLITAENLPTLQKRYGHPDLRNSNEPYQTYQKKFTCSEE
jgi:hypothetical protein